MSNANHTRQKQRGFTMIELSLVLFIVLIALSLTVRQFAQANTESDRLATVTYLQRAQNSIRQHFVGRSYTGLTGLNHNILMPEELRPGVGNVFSLPLGLSLDVVAVDEYSFALTVIGDGIADASTCVSIAAGMSRFVYSIHVGRRGVIMSSEQNPASVADIADACQNLDGVQQILLQSR